MYRTHYSSRKTVQSEPIPGKKMVANSAGGYAFALDDWKRLDRFLVLGSEGGTYYIGEHKLTVDNAEAVRRCILSDGRRTVDRIVEISEAGRAPKNDPALFALAMCASLGDVHTKRVALDALPRVARIGTHLFHFAQYVEGFRGWGRSLRNAVGNWYLSRDADALAFQLVKYQSRDGWSHRDLLRLSHPKTAYPQVNAALRWATHGDGENLPRAIEGFKLAQTAENKKQVVTAITDYGLPREAIPTQYLSDPDVQAALLPHMGITALIRNLGNMSKSGLLSKTNLKVVGDVTAKITDKALLKKGRVHPLQLLAALNTYGSGKGFRGSGTWETVAAVVDALDEGFYLAFDAVEPTGKRYLLGLDVSGSMGFFSIAGVGGITPAMGAAAMLMVTRKTEPSTIVCAFAKGFRPLDFGKRERLDAIMKVTAINNFGGTDCAVPMTYALKQKAEVDVFCVYTDSETWAGSIHPVQALRQYRDTMGIDAKLIVVGMTATEFTIADPDDAGMLDVVGFDTTVPDVMAQFVGG